MESYDLEFCRQALEEAKRSQAEDARVHPKVGVVIVKDGAVVATAFRGEVVSNHAEYHALEGKLEKAELAGATVYTTLEPCTSRNHPKVPCAERLIERKVARVVIGMLDPNPVITGKGQRRLREANIITDFFPSDVMSGVEELNREFTRFYEKGQPVTKEDETFARENHSRSLDDWYRSINRIYWYRNFNMNTMALFSHLVEAFGGLSLLASAKNKPGVRAESFLPKALAWWLALCGKSGIKSVEDMVWSKFPKACSYCHESPHKAHICTQKKLQKSGPDWAFLNEMAKNQFPSRPRSLGQWQSMFADIYPAQQTEDYGSSFARLTEELGELAEALRVFPAAPGYFLSEAADVFAWLMHVQNIIELKANVPVSDVGKTLERWFAINYPDRCLDCNNDRCACPPILPSTIGRIAHEVPPEKGNFTETGSFMTPDMLSKLFMT